MRAMAAGLALGLASMAWAAGVSTGPTVETASAPASVKAGEKLDLSTPTAAVAAFWRAARAGDAGGMKQALEIAEGDRAAVEAYVNLAAGSAGVVKAAEKQFGARDAKVYDELELVPTEGQIKELGQANVVITGEQATVTLKAGSRTIELKRIDGGWKIDAASAFGTKAAEEAMDTINRLAAAMNENRAQIVRGDFGSATAAVHGLQEKLLAIAEKKVGESATTAATRP